MQELVFDGVKSAYLGRPIIYDSIRECRGPAWTVATASGKQLNREQVMAVIDGFFAEQYTRNATQVRRCWQIV